MSIVTSPSIRPKTLPSADGVALHRTILTDVDSPFSTAKQVRSFRDVQSSNVTSPPPSIQKPTSCSLLPTFQQSADVQPRKRTGSPFLYQTRKLRLLRSPTQSMNRGRVVLMSQPPSVLPEALQRMKEISDEAASVQKPSAFQ